MRRTGFLIALTAAVLAPGATPGEADADIGVRLVKPAAARPGAFVELTIFCGGCRRTLNLPISIIPVADAPRTRDCPRGTCGPTAASPPRTRPYVFVGIARPYRLRFRVPQVAPGRYAFVIFCAPCVRGPRGSLITNTREDTLLVRR
jgi:hypothetical protein